MEQSAPRPAWWQDASAVERVVRDLVGAELALARPGRTLPAQP